MATNLLRCGVAGAPNLPWTHIRVGRGAKFVFDYQRPQLSHSQVLSRGQHEQIRAYRRQIFNYRTFQATRGILTRWSAMPTFKYQMGGLVGACAAFYTINLESVPVSGRRRFNVVNKDWEKSMGEQQYAMTMQEFGQKIMPSSAPEHRLVQRVLDRLIPKSGLQDEEWEIHVIDDPMKNAFVIPGGKVFVFRGILDVCQDENGLAAVLGHEIAHNVAHHAAERMSSAFIFLPLAMVAFALAGLDPSLGRVGANIAFQLPGSRKQEAEADYIGLLMMSESCYDPTAAVGLWGRMEKEEQNAPPQFLSTHPSSHNRQEKIRGWLPLAEEKALQTGCAVTRDNLGDFRQLLGSLPDVSS